VYGHFYDPINNDGIPIVGGGEAKNKAINWSNGLTDALSGTFNPDLTRRNHFTWLDARRAYFKSLTYQTEDATLSIVLDEYESEARLFFLASMMKSLGHVTHILQDGAQPQHSRLDAHNHSAQFWAGLFNKPLGRRMMEVYTNIRVTRDIALAPLRDRVKLRRMFSDADGNVDLPPALVIGSYPIPQFATPRRFMTTRSEGGGDPINARAGIFDFSNRGFFTEGTATGRPNLKTRVMPSPPPDLTGTTLVAVPDGDEPFSDVAWIPPDPVSPSYVDAVDAIYAGLTPLGQVDSLTGLDPSIEPGLVMEPRHYRNHANVLIPRAIAYSAGLLNYFFRGTLEIEPIDQKVFAVANQGEPHTIDAAGWPRKTTGGGVFGFEKFRLKVRNITDPITEPGGAPTAQPVGPGGKLYAIARYHRNSCYKADLSGERTQTYAAPPLVGAITEPTCGALGTRTVFQDISVSAPIPINGVADLPGGSGAPLPASVEKTFDFAMDPIPINATDLVLQVVYRGTLGEEPESVALGMLDVREPTIMTFWENTDYYLDTGNPPWKPSVPAYPIRQIRYFRFCIRPNGGERLAYWFAPPLAGFAMNTPRGSIRVAVIVPKPTSPTDTFRVKGTPVIDNNGPNGPMLAIVRTSVGRIAQSNREFISAATAASPTAGCNATLPTAEEYWCNDPLQRRRGALLGSGLQPMAWLTGNVTAFNTTDVGDFIPSVPSSSVQPLGEVRFNDTVALSNCPTQPLEQPKSAAQVRLNELEEVARSLGIKL